MNVYKINDIINCEFLKIPKTMFANQNYRSLSSDAKLTYALLYDRLSLSKLNGWINGNDEVYLIYTRDEIAEDLGISYKKAISAFKELVDIGLITEHRCGRGMPNRIYIVKPEVDAESAKKYVKRENLRTADSACLTGSLSTYETDTPLEDMPKTDIKKCEDGTSRTAETGYQELPKPQSNKTNIIKTDFNNTDNSQSVSMRRTIGFYTETPETLSYDGQTDTIYSFDDILENCQLDTFDEEERKILYDAMERLYYSESLKIGNAHLPQNKVRSRMYEIDVTVLQSVIAKLHQNDRQIKNITAYVMSTLFNCITEEYSLLHVDPYLNSLREIRRE